MTIFIIVLLTILTFAFIIYPLYKQTSHTADSIQDEELQELYFQRDTAYSMIKELEFDLESGVLTKGDYLTLEKSYKAKAISILKKIDKMKDGSKVEDEIERQVLEMRQSKSRLCPKCGAKYQIDNRFCSRCGTALSQGGKD